MTSWRLSKYDPSRRDASGSFPGGDWTSVPDIGVEFEGEALTEESYIRWENAYVAVVLAFYKDLGSPDLVARDVELHEPQHLLHRPPDANGSCALLEEGVVSGAESLEAVVRCCLREWAWCRLQDRTGMVGIHFGYDYYMYLSGQRMSSDVIALAAGLGLFVESFPSPYL